MTIDAQPTLAKAYCNVLAIQKGLDPAGHAGHFEDALLIETPLPWKQGAMREPGTMPPELLKLFEVWMDNYRAGKGYPHRPLLIAPDDVYSREGYRRLIYYTRAAGAFAEYSRIEYLVPEDKLGALGWALYEARDELDQFEEYRVTDKPECRDILVCTHGTIDVACAKFGYPLYKTLRDDHASDTLRVWRVSHFGGHVFAPTIMDMPTGHFWAYVEPPQAQQIVQRTGDVTLLRGHYRGWSGVEYGFAQAAEREIWQREGWQWFEYLKSGEVLAKDDNEENPQWAEVRITYTTPDDNTPRIYEARVEVQHSITTPHTSNKDATHPYPQYTVLPRS